MGLLPEGSEFRAPRLEEAAAVAELFNALAMSISGKPDSSEEMVRWYWSGPSVTMDDDLRVVVSPGSQVVSYLEYETFEPWTQLFSSTLITLGIGTTLADWRSSEPNEVQAAPTVASPRHRPGIVADVSDSPSSDVGVRGPAWAWTLRTRTARWLSTGRQGCTWSAERPPTRRCYESPPLEGRYLIWAAGSALKVCMQPIEQK